LGWFVERGIGPLRLHVNTTWRTPGKELDIARIGPGGELDINIQIRPNVTFCEEINVVGGRPVIDVAEEFISMVELIVKDIEYETFRLKSLR
jgi:hypothetical protein